MYSQEKLENLFEILETKGYIDSTDCGALTDRIMTPKLLEELLNYRNDLTLLSTGDCKNDEAVDNYIIYVCNDDEVVDLDKYLKEARKRELKRLKENDIYE